MRRRNRPHIKQAHNNHVHRWTVSYADYMTLMFALFVVLYAVLLNKKDNYQEVIDAIQSAGQFVHKTPSNLQSNELLAPTIVTQDETLSKEPLETPESDLTVEINKKIKPELSVIPSSDQGESLAKLKLSLESALNVELASGAFSVNLEGDWLTIEMTGPLLFAAGSHTLLNGAKRNIKYIAEVLKPVNNMIRLRGYTDTKPISDEIYQSNWELSALRAISVLHALNDDGIAGARMAIEGFGQYQPVLSEKGDIDEFKSRRVVIAISRFALFVEPKSDNNIKVKIKEKENSLPTPIPKPDSEEIREVFLPDGRLIITTRQE